MPSPDATYRSFLRDEEVNIREQRQVADKVLFRDRFISDAVSSWRVYSDDWLAIVRPYDVAAVKSFDRVKAERPLAGPLHRREFPLHLTSAGSEFRDVSVTSESAPIFLCHSVSGEHNSNAVTTLLCVEPLDLLHAALPLQTCASADHVDLGQYLALLACGERTRPRRHVSQQANRQYQECAAR